MKYFFDTEFLEGPQKKSYLGGLLEYGQFKPTIDLISIGIVSEDNRECYAVSKDFNLKEAWNRYQTPYDDVYTGGKEYWIRENVLFPIFFELAWLDFHSTHYKDVWLNEDKELAKKDFIVEGLANNFKWFKKLIQKYGKTNNEIADEIKNFIYSCEGQKYLENSPNIESNPPKNFISYNPIEFYAYYADYDWVVFCWLFGKMIDLPKGFPMYCKDLKQMLDEKAEKHLKADQTIKDKIRTWKSTKENYPKQEDEHNALSDARWDKKLYGFIKSEF